MRTSARSGFPTMFFPLYTRVAPPIHVPTTSFKLIALQNIREEEALLSKGASVTMKETSHPIQSRKVKRRKLKSVIMHCKKSWTSQIGFYLMRMWTLNTLCFHREISEVAIVKIFHLKVHQCRSENLLTRLSLYKNNEPKVSHYNTFYFLRYPRGRYVKYLFTNIPKQ